MTGRSTSRDRHGRGLRSSAAGPRLPFLQTRIELFDDIVAGAAEYLRDLWPDDLDGVVFEVAALPAADTGSRLARWHVDSSRRRIVMYRLPIERLARPHEPRSGQDAAWDHRMLIEGCVFRAVGELLGKDPWDLAPDRYRDR